MLGENGSISFVSELIELVDNLLNGYEALQGLAITPLERGLVARYLLGAICCDARLIAECLDRTSVMKKLDPQSLLQECVESDPERAAEERALILRELSRCGWLEMAQSTLAR